MEFDGDPMDFQRSGAGDEKLYVVFYMGILKDDAASVEQGRPIFRDVEMVRIFTPGDRSNVPDRPVRPSDKIRWAKAYEAFKAGKDDAGQIQGTPLSEWPGVGRAQGEELRYLGVRTVEQLAEVRDDITLKVPGLLRLRDSARVWLGKAKATAESAKAAKELEELRGMVATLEKTVHELNVRNEALSVRMTAKETATG